MTAKPAPTEIELITGKNPILLIAPHGIYGDDDNTDKLTRKMAQRLNCYAVINGIYSRPVAATKNKPAKVADKAALILNLNSISQITAHLKDEFLDPIIKYTDEIKAINGSPLVVLIHGIENKNANNHYGKDTDIVIGIGLGHGSPDSLSCDRKLSDKLQGLLGKSGTKKIRTVYSDNYLPTAPTSKYAGSDEDNLNQLFANEKSKVRDTTVQSLQLEIRKAGFRDSAKNINSTAERLSVALAELAGVKLVGKEVALTPKETQPDTPLVEKAFETLAGIFVSHYINALLEAGRYIIDNFYDGQIELARAHKPTKGKSLNQLIQMLQGRDGDAPSRSWIFNSVVMVIDENDYKSVHSYGQLSQSHKVILLTIKDRALKTSLIEEVVAKGLTVNQLKERIAGLMSENEVEMPLRRAIANPQLLFSEKWHEMITKESLAKLPEEEVVKIRDKAQAKIESLEAELAKTGEYIKKYRDLIAGLGKDGKANLELQ